MEDTLTETVVDPSSVKLRLRSCTTKSIAEAWKTIQARLRPIYWKSFNQNQYVKYWHDPQAQTIYGPETASQMHKGVCSCESCFMSQPCPTASDEVMLYRLCETVARLVILEGKRYHPSNTRDRLLNLLDNRLTSFAPCRRCPHRCNDLLPDSGRNDLLQAIDLVKKCEGILSVEPEIKELLKLRLVQQYHERLWLEADTHYHHFFTSHITAQEINNLIQKNMASRRAHHMPDSIRNDTPLWLVRQDIAVDSGDPTAPYHSIVGESPRWLLSNDQFISTAEMQHLVATCPEVKEYWDCGAHFVRNQEDVQNVEQDGLGNYQCTVLISCPESLDCSGGRICLFSPPGETEDHELPTRRGVQYTESMVDKAIPSMELDTIILDVQQTCPLCLEDGQKGQTVHQFPCRHWTCKKTRNSSRQCDGICEWINNTENPSCPLCRRNLF